MRAKPLFIATAALEAMKAVGLCAVFALWGFSAVEGGAFIVAQALSGSVFAILALLEASTKEESSLRRVALPWKAIGLAPSILALASFRGKGPLPASTDIGISLILLFIVIADLCSIFALALAGKRPTPRSSEAGGAAGGA
jgi:hypothetical protein